VHAAGNDHLSAGAELTDGARDDLGRATPPAPEESDRPVARRGSLNVAARGGWADLYVDGEHVGRTPRSIQLSAGRHVVELRRDAESLSRRVVTIRAGRAERIVIDL